MIGLNRGGLTDAGKAGHPEITASCNRHRTGRLRIFCALRPAFQATTLALRNKALCQSSHPGESRFTSRNKDVVDNFRRAANKGGRLQAAVAAVVRQPIPSPLAAPASLSLNESEQLL